MSTPNPASQDIAQILITAGIAVVGATSTQWGISAGSMPDSPNTSIMVTDQGGLDANPALGIDDLFIQVLIRSSVDDYQGGMVKAQAIKDILLGIAKQTVGGTVYVGITMRGDIISLGPDERRRYRFSTNWRVWRSPTNTTNRQLMS